MYDRIIEAHTVREYGSLPTTFLIDDIKSRYSIFPNEALYIIDCEQVQFEPLTDNLHKIIGIDGPMQNDITHLYEHIADRNINAAIQWVEAVLSCAFDEKEGITPEVDLFRCLYLSKDHRVILKCTTPLAYDSFGNMRYSLGKLIDVTGIVPFQHFSYSFLGPSNQKLYDLFEERKNVIHILSNREIEILNLIGMGYSSQDIASKLFISKLTVDKHRRNIIAKMETRTALEAYLKYKNMALI